MDRIKIDDWINEIIDVNDSNKMMKKEEIWSKTSKIVSTILKQREYENLVLTS